MRRILVTIHIIKTVCPCRNCFRLTNAKVSSRTRFVKPILSPLMNTKPYRATASTSWSAVSASLASDMSITGIFRLEPLLGSGPIFPLNQVQTIESIATLYYYCVFEFVIVAVFIPATVGLSAGPEYSRLRVST